MEFRQSLSRRILIAFVLMTALVGGTFALGIVATVHLVEERLISGALGGDLDRLLQMDSMDEWRHVPEPAQLFYFSDGPGDFSLPEDLLALDPGFTRCSAASCPITPWYARWMAAVMCCCRIRATSRRASGCCSPWCWWASC